MRKGIYLLFICIFSFSFISCGEKEEVEIESKQVQKESGGLEEKLEIERILEIQKIEDEILREKKAEEEALKKKYNEENKETEEKINNEMVTIVIDPGHSSRATGEKEKASPNSNKVKLKETSGGVSRIQKVPEYVVTHRVGNKLKEALEKEGYNVKMTKTKIEESISNIERAEFGNEMNADLVLRLHLDSAEGESAKGGSMLVPTESGYITKEVKEKSRGYGEKIMTSYSESTGITNRGIIERSDLSGFNWSKVPVVLLEMGFFSNIEEEKFFLNENNDKKIIDGIVKGVKSIKFD